MTQLQADKVSSYVAALCALKDDHRLRSLRPREGIDFSSNDYLALASAPRMRKA
ncbi:MAG TPA: 8-amino-7-oxononanoate synthase, partial [Bradyrhizobium sp.]|nr:8-amino-7-oxononanoate synthase [Bradyrhizobium sp.]